MSDALQSELNLEVFNDGITESLYDSLQYPCVIVCGIKLEYELEFLRTRVTDEAKSLPLYAYVDNKFVDVGKVELSLNALLLLKCVNDYTLYLCKSKDLRKELDLKDPNMFLKFISI